MYRFCNSFALLRGLQRFTPSSIRRNEKKALPLLGSLCDTPDSYVLLKRSPYMLRHVLGLINTDTRLALISPANLSQAFAKMSH